MSKTVLQKNQHDLLLEHFKKVGNISALEASALFKIRALPRRISDLEKVGHEFKRERKTDSTGQRYVRYHYLGKRSVHQL